MSARKTHTKLDKQNLSNFTQQYRNPIKGFHFLKKKRSLNLSPTQEKQK